MSSPADESSDGQSLHPARVLYRSPRLQFALAVVLCALPLVVWAFWDTRPPDDHDYSYTGTAFALLAEWEAATGRERASLLIQNFFFRGSHPQGTQTLLFLTLVGFGATRLVYRLAVLPFLLLLIGGSYLAGRRILGHREALLVAFIVSMSPFCLEMTRQWELHFCAAGLSACSLALALSLLLQPDRNRSLWVALGLLSGLRLYFHPVAVPDIVATYASLGLLLVVFDRSSERLRRCVNGCLSLGCATAVGSWMLGFWHRQWPPPSWVMSRYFAGRAKMVAPDTERFDAVDGLLSLPGRLQVNLGEEWLLLLFIPGLLFLLPALRAATGERRSALRFLTLSIGVQLPIAVMATSAGGFVTDWVALVIPTTVLALAVLEWQLFATRPRLRRLWIFAVLACGLAVAWVPLGLSILGPDPIQDPAAYHRSAWTARFVVSEGGGVMRTHDTASRSVGAVSELPRTLRSAWPGHPAASPARLGISALVRVSREPRSATTTPSEKRGCVWSKGDLPQLSQEALHGLFAVNGFPAGVRTIPAKQARFVLVGLVDHSIQLPVAFGVWRPEVGVDLSCLEQARRQVEAQLGGEARVLSDPAMVLYGSSNRPLPHVDFLLLDRGLDPQDGSRTGAGSGEGWQ